MTRFEGQLAKSETPIQPERVPVQPEIPTQPETPIRSETPIRPESENHWDPAANLQLLRQFKINEPAASRLAALRYVTPAYIRAHVEEVRALGQDLGMAIYRIEHHWPVRPTPSISRPVQMADSAAQVGAAPRYRLRSAPIGVHPEGYELTEVTANNPPGAVHPRPINLPKEELPENFEANVQALLEWKGSELVANRLALLPHVTPEFIREHYRQAFENNQDVITALYRIEHNEPLPETWIHGEVERTDVRPQIAALGERLRPRRRIAVESGNESTARS